LRGWKERERERKSMLPVNKPLLGREEVEAATRVIESGLLTDPSAAGGPNVRAFEGELAGYIGVKHAVMLNSGTAALYAALLAVGIGPGDEVVVPSFTFVATANSVMMAGAKPVFVDIDERTFTMSPEAFRRAITPKTRAVMPVDLYGLPAEMGEIKEVAAEGGIMVIEDACQAQGAAYRGRMAGALGDLGCFSFYPGKVMTTGEGGAVVTDSDELAERVRRIRTHGQVKGYDSVIFGANFRMPEVEAAIGRVQLKRLPGFLEARRRNAEALTAGLAGGRGPAAAVPPGVPEGSRHNWYLYTVRFRSAGERDAMKARLAEKGIGSAVYYPTPVHRIPFYAGKGFAQADLPSTERAAETVLSIPVNPLVTEQDVERIVAVIRGGEAR